MKLFSRKSLVAGATAIAVSFAGVNVATAEKGASQPTGTVDASANNEEKKQDEGNKDDQNQDDQNQDDNGSSISDLSSNEDGTEMTPKQKAEAAKAWIGVISAVIGVLGSIFAFITKYVDIPGQK